MRALILVGGACLALAACQAQAPEQNNDAIPSDGNTAVEVVPDDGNYTAVNTEQPAADCPEGRKCLPDSAPVD